MASVIVSLKNVADWLGICAPVVVEAAMGTVDRDVCDARLANWAPRVLARAGVTLEVLGQEHLAANRPMVLMSNHASFYDIPVVYAVFGGKLLMVAKKELFRIPIVGGAMRGAGMIEVDRNDRSKAIGNLDKGARALFESGSSVWIAPEGTRSTTGTLGPFKKGGFYLALRGRLPILPISIKGTFALLPPHSVGTRTKVPVAVTIHEPIDTGSFATAAAGDEKAAVARLMEVVRAAIASGL